MFCYHTVFYESLLGFIPTYFIKQWIRYYQPNTGGTTIEPGHFHQHTLPTMHNLFVNSSINSVRDVEPGASVESPTNEASANNVVTDYEQTVVKLAKHVRQVSDVSTMVMYDETTENAKGSGGAKETVTENTTGDGEADDGENNINDMPIERLYSLLANPDIVNKELKRQDSNLGDFGHNLITIGIVEEIRARIFHRTFKYPPYCKNIAISSIVIWSLTCAIITTIWCLWFESTLIVSNEFDDQLTKYHECSISDEWQYANVYHVNDHEKNIVPLKLWFNYNSTQDHIEKIMSAFDGIAYEPPTNDTFGDNLKVSSRFLLCVFLSYLLSVFFWNPIRIALMTILKLRKYLNNPDKIGEAKLFYNEQHRRTAATVRSSTITAISTAEPSADSMPDQVVQDRHHDHPEQQLHDDIELPDLPQEKFLELLSEPK